MWGKRAISPGACTVEAFKSILKSKKKIWGERFQGRSIDRHGNVFYLQRLPQGKRHKALIGSRGFQRDDRCTQVDGHVQICQDCRGATQWCLCARPIQPQFCHLKKNAMTVDCPIGVIDVGIAGETRECLSVPAGSASIASRVGQIHGREIAGPCAIFEQCITKHGPFV